MNAASPELESATEAMRPRKPPTSANFMRVPCESMETMKRRVSGALKEAIM
jgi:hypothetical protein